jgi:hypothetical protein
LPQTNGNEFVVRRIIRRTLVFQLRRVISLCWLGFALILPLLFVSVAPSRAQDVASPAAQAKPSEPAPNAAVTARWPKEDTPQHTTGRAPTPAPSVEQPPNVDQKPRGWSALLPKDSAPASKAASAPAASKTSQRGARAQVAKAKSPRAVASPRSQRSAVAPARAAKPAAHAAPPRVAKRSAKPHRPLALTPPTRTSRRPS